MKIVDFWRDFVATHSTANNYDADIFVAQLNENVPDWREQVRDRDIWPELHTQGNNYSESSYIDVIIREAGLEFALYLAENQSKWPDSGCAFRYCLEHIHNNWIVFPDSVKEKILNSYLREFLNACLEHRETWNSLSDHQKRSIFDNLKEDQYVSDLLLLKMWAEELDFRRTPYLAFTNHDFQHFADRVIRERERNWERDRDDIDITDRDRDRGRDRFERMLEEHLRHLRQWDWPTLTFDFNRYPIYTPSTKLQSLRDVANFCQDEDSLTRINRIIRDIEHRLHRFHRWG